MGKKTKENILMKNNQTIAQRKNLFNPIDYITHSKFDFIQL